MRRLFALLAVVGAGAAYAGDIPDKYLKLHDQAISDPKAFQQLQILATQGDAYAQYCFAGLYNPDATECKQDTLADQKVTTVKVDPKAAIKWYRLAALQGDDLAAEELGTLYVGTDDVPEDMVLAVQWWMVAINTNPNGPGGFNAAIALSAVKDQLTEEQLAKARAGAHGIEAEIKKKKH